MTQQGRQIIIFFVLAAVSYGVWKYYFDREEIIPEQPFTKGYSVDNLELQITNENGEFAARFVSPSLIRYTDSDLVQIKTPEFWTYLDGQENWQFRSKNAKYDYKKQEVMLQERVEAVSLNSEEEIEFKSNDLLVLLEEKSATTERGIKVKKENLSMTGNQAQFDFKINEIKVKDNVKVIYKNSN